MTNDNDETNETRPEAIAAKATPPRKPKAHHAPPRLPPSRTPSPLLSVEEAAVVLRMTPEGLRARLRRAAEKRGDTVIARLGAAAVGMRIGRHWRIRVTAQDVK